MSTSNNSARHWDSMRPNCFLRRDARARQRTGQGGLEIQHALQAPAIGKHLAHRVRGEQRIEQARGRFVRQRVRVLAYG